MALQAKYTIKPNENAHRETEKSEWNKMKKIYKLCAMRVCKLYDWIFWFMHFHVWNWEFYSLSFAFMFATLRMHVAPTLPCFNSCAITNIFNSGKTMPVEIVQRILAWQMNSFSLTISSGTFLLHFIVLMCSILRTTARFSSCVWPNTIFFHRECLPSAGKYQTIMKWII